MSSPFSQKEINEHVQRVEDRPGHSLDVGAELEPGQAKPTATIEYQGEHAGEKVTIGWGAWAKTQFTKGTRAAGAKLGLKW